MPLILATQEDSSLRVSRQIACETLSRKTHHKKGLVEWLKWSKVQDPEFKPRTARKKKKKGLQNALLC
jgi:hypothetical protein